MKDLRKIKTKVDILVDGRVYSNTSFVKGNKTQGKLESGSFS